MIEFLGVRYAYPGAVDPALDGQTRALRLLGTRGQIDAWLQGLRLTSTLPNAAGAVAFVEVVADDRASEPLRTTARDLAECQFCGLES
jgi:hypothetical protein